MRCPACLQPLNAVKVARVDLGACPRCGGLWLPRQELLELASEQTVQEIVGAARGKPGRCAACGERLIADAPCPPLRRGSTPGELQLLARRTADVMRVQRKAFKSTNREENAGRVTCAACQKRLYKADVFLKDEKYYCGSCCPSGAAPMVRDGGRAPRSAPPAATRRCRATAATPCPSSRSSTPSWSWGGAEPAGSAPSQGTISPPQHRLRPSR